MAYSQEELNSIVDGIIIDNTTNQVTPAKVRSVFKAVISSLDQTNAGSVTANPPLNYDAFTNVFSILKADAVTNGYLSKEDWVLFNSAVGGATPDATTSVKGKLKLAGDLGGTADLPTVPALVNKENISNKTGTVVGNESSTSLYPNILGAWTYFQQKLTDSIFGTFINSLTAKTTPIDADYDVIMDSADSNKAKKVSFANRKATLKTYFDTLYQVILVSGTNIKTINSTSILGSGNLNTPDMDTTTAQTVSGVKTFLNLTWGFRNVANTFTSFFTNTNTASRTYTFQNRNGTIADNTDLALKASLTGDTFTGAVIFPASTTTVAPIRLPEGVTKSTSPVTGDLQNLSDKVQIRRSSSWYSFMFSNAPNPDLNTGTTKALTVDSVGMPVVVDLQSIVVNTVALVSGVATITITGVTTSSICMATQMITPSGVQGVKYKAVCTASTLTITAIDLSGTTIATDTSTISYTILL